MKNHFRVLFGSATAILISASALQLSAATGDLYEADFSSGIIYRFNPEGQKSVFASGLADPEGMTYDAAHNLFVSETAAGTISKFALDGSKTLFASGLNGPASLIFDAAGNLYDAEFFGGVIYKFTPQGDRTTFATGLSGPANLLFDSNGNLFETDFQSGTIYRFTPDGTRTTFATGVGKPHGLAFDSAGNLFVANFQGGTILRFTPAGARTTFATGLSGPHGLAFDASGNLFEADYNTGQIYKFAPDGTRTTFASGLSNPANLQFEPALPTADHQRLLNLSTRAFVGTETGVLIGGFILQGESPTTLVLRAIGPSLANRGVGDALEDPLLELYDGSGTLLQSNNDWQSGPDASAIQAAGLAPQNAKESALRASLNAGNYTAIVRGVGDATPVGGFQPGITGVGLVEVYDLQATDSRAVNISTRGTVLSGENVMIAGCIIGGDAAKQLVLRAIGPSLRDHGVGDALNNPRLELFNSNGSPLAANDDWQQNPDAADIQSRGLAPASALESALIVSLAPGSYTGIESPSPGESGIGLIEIYDLGSPE